MSAPTGAPGGALSHVRVCDFTGQLAGAGATKWLAAFGAEVIRIEDPVTHGLWDILRTMPPFVDHRRGPDFGGGFNNHNVGKWGITLNLRTQRAREILAEIVRRSDVVTENFSKGVLARWGFDYGRLRELRPDIVYVSNSGFGHDGPYSDWKTWGPIVQAVSGLTHLSGLPGREPAGWGYSYMDHTGGMYMAMAVMLALLHRQRTGEGQWVDMSCTDAALSLTGTAVLDWTVNGRSSRREGWPDANRSAHAPWAPHGIYPAAGDDDWIAIVCRSDAEWEAVAARLGIADAARFASASARLAQQDALDAAMAAATMHHERYALARDLQAAGVAAAAVARPGERIDGDPSTAAWGLWPESTHTKLGRVRVDGLPVHLSRTDWHIEQGGPCLGEHTELVLNRVLGMSADEVAQLRAEGVV